MLTLKASLRQIIEAESPLSGRPCCTSVCLRPRARRTSNHKQRIVGTFWGDIWRVLMSERLPGVWHKQTEEYLPKSAPPPSHHFPLSSFPFLFADASVAEEKRESGGVKILNVRKGQKKKEQPKKRIHISACASGSRHSLLH